MLYVSWANTGIIKGLYSNKSQTILRSLMWLYLCSGGDREKLIKIILYYTELREGKINHYHPEGFLVLYGTHG